MVIVGETKKCAGCRACELACSYHHRQLFSPSIASIRIKRRGVGEIVDLLLYGQAKDGHLACNCPEGSEFCLHFCPDIARDELRAILQLRRGNK